MAVDTFIIALFLYCRADLTIENQSYKSSTAVSCNFTTVDSVPSYQNPLYDADTAPQARNTGNSVIYEDIDYSHYEAPFPKNTFKID
jgi:hypothetical protein